MKRASEIQTLSAALDVLQRHIKDCGPCDHSVGICVCVRISVR